jgi:HK97 family phage portal protein
MGMFSWIGKALQKTQNDIRKSFSVKWTTVSRRAASAYSDLFHTSPRLDAVDIIATDCANAGFKVYNKHQLRADEKNAPAMGDHPVYDILENPIPGRPDFDGFSLRYLTSVFLEIHGECFWFIVRDTRGLPVEIYLAPTTWVIQTPSDTAPYYLLMPLGNTSSMTLNVDPEDVVYFKMPNAVQPYDRGRGRTEAIGDEIEASEYAIKYAKNFFFNDATPKSLVTAPGAQDDQLKAFKAAWDLQFRGTANGNKTGFVGWDAKVLKLSDNPHEMDFIESMKALADMCRQHYQIPPEIFGILENSNRSTIDSAYYLYAKNVLLKRFSRLEAVINRQLMPMFGKDMVLKFDNPVQEDQEFRLKVSTEGYKIGTVDRDEWRVANGFKPYGGEIGKELSIPMATSALLSDGKLPNRLELQGPLDTEPGSADAVSDDDEEEDELPEPLPTSKSVKAPQIPSNDALWESFYKIAQTSWPAFESGTKEFAKEQKKAFRLLFDEYVADGMDLVAALNQSAAEIYGLAATDAATFKKLAPAWAKALRDGFDIADNLLGGGVSWDLYNPQLTAWLRTHGLQAAKEINGTTKKELLKLAPKIEEALANGKGINDIAKMLNGVYSKLGTTRAQMIAQTETMTSINQGQFEVYKNEGVKTKIWLHSRLPNGRDNHRALDGKTIPIDDSFDMGGGVKMLHPGDSNGGASNIVSCHCTIAPGSKDE